MMIPRCAPALLAALACASAPPTPAARQAPIAPLLDRAAIELRDPPWLPPQAREALAARMERHGADMVFLMAAILLLDHDEAERLALHVAEEPRLGRPAPGEKETLAALMPRRFFDLQDALHVRAREVATAAHGSDDAAIAKAYGRLAETCVACHSTYLANDDVELPDELDDEPEPEPRPVDLIAPTGD